MDTEKAKLGLIDDDIANRPDQLCRLLRSVEVSINWKFAVLILSSKKEVLLDKLQVLQIELSLFHPSVYVASANKVVSRMFSVHQLA